MTKHPSPAAQVGAGLPEALTFDDVLLIPRHSKILPSQVDEGPCLIPTGCTADQMCPEVRGEDLGRPGEQGIDVGVHLFEAVVARQVGRCVQRQLCYREGIEVPRSRVH